jgi:hypothetical protein
VHPDNPRYFTDGSGKAIYLAGLEYWDTLYDDGTPHADAMEYSHFLDIAQQYGVNLVRLWRWNELARFSYERDAWERYAGSLIPWRRTGPGTALDGRPNFDLNRFDPAYFRLLRSRVLAARGRGLYVSVMLFEGHSLQHSDPPWRWAGHPFHKDNNVNGVDGDVDGDGMGVETHSWLGRDHPITRYQWAYVRKVVDTVGDLDNVLYEVANESHNGSLEWQGHIVEYIHQYERSRRKQHPVGISVPWGGSFKPGVNAELLQSPADWIAPNFEAPGGYSYRDNPPPADGRRVIISDTDHLWGASGDGVWVWKSFLRGLNVINYMEWPQLRDPSPTLAGLRQAMRNTRACSERMDLAATTPRPDLASSTYCLANPGREYLVYVPEGGEVTVDLSTAAGELTVEWVNPRTGVATEAGTVEGGAVRSLNPPFDGHAVLHLRASGKE